MAADETVTLTGQSGTPITFYKYPWGTPLAAVGGVYAALRFDQSGGSAVCIGQTGNLSERFDNHHHAYGFARQRVTHVAALRVESEAQRRAIEEDLVRNYRPALNQTPHG